MNAGKLRDESVCRRNVLQTAVEERHEAERAELEPFEVELRAKLIPRIGDVGFIGANNSERELLARRRPK